MHRVIAMLLGMLVVAFQAHATDPPIQSTGSNAASLQASPAFVLAGPGSRNDAWRTVTAADGSLHVIAYLGAAKEYRHIRMPAFGPPVSATIPIIDTPAFRHAPGLDAAFDRDGNLHVVAGGGHLVQRAGSWQEAAPPPWAREGIRVHGARFVPGARDLTWIFSVKGKEIEAKGRWGIVIAGGLAGALILPWHYQSQKLLVASDAAAGIRDWTVIDKGDRGDAAFSVADGDAAGNIHVHYAHAAGYSYARVSPRPDDEASPDTTSSKAVDVMRAVDGRSLPTATVRFDQRNIPSNWFWPQFAIDPDSGQALTIDSAADTWLLDASQAWQPHPALPAPARPVHLGRGHGGAFPLLATIKGTPQDRKAMSLLLYRFDGGAWSEPLVIDAHYRPGWLVPDARLAQAGPSRVLATWRGKQGLMARWIDLPAATAVARDDGSDASSLPWLRITDLRPAGDAITRFALNQRMPRLDFSVPEPLQRRVLESGLTAWMRQHPDWSPREVECEILAFKVHAPSNWVAWKVNAEVQLRLRNGGREQLLSGSTMQKTASLNGPTLPFVETVMADALGQVASALPAAVDMLLLTPPAPASLPTSPASGSATQ